MSKYWKGQRSPRKSIFFSIFCVWPQLRSPVKTLVNEQELYPCLRVTTCVYIIQICNMKLLWLSITFLGGSQNHFFLSRQNKLAFWAGCREKGNEIYLFWGQIWVIWVAVTLDTNFQLSILLFRFSKGRLKTQIIQQRELRALEGGVAPKLWRAEISKRLWIGIFKFACVHYTYRCALEINFSQIWEVTWTNSQDFGWFDTEWPFCFFLAALSGVIFLKVFQLAMLILSTLICLLSIF